MPADWDQVIDLYASAKQLPPEEWDEFLRCQTADLQLLKEVASLLQVDLPANDPLERPVMDWFPVESRSTESNAILPRLLIGETLAKRFLISHFLGRGGMGEVYGAKDLELGETVAIKVLHPDLAAQPSFLERFRREIRLTRRISHPNVARVFDMVQDPSHPLGPLSFYVMEKLDGETLAARIKRDGRVPMNEALNIARQLAAGLGAAHLAGVIHRDFKPANVMLAGERVVITDFGLAAPIAADGQVQLKTTSLLLGTPGYVAPEQWAGKPATTASDIYAFGVVLHEMVTGEHPNKQAVPPVQWDAVIRRCLQMEPKARWATAAAAVKGLEPGWLTRRKLVSGAAAAGVVSLCGAGLRFYQQGRIGSLPGSRIMLLPTDNKSTDPSLAGWRVALFRQLDLSRQVKPEDVPVGVTHLSQPSEIRESALRAGIRWILFSAVTPIAGELSLQVRMELMGPNAQYPARVWRKEWSAANRQDLLRMAAVAGDWVRETAGEAPDEVRARSQAPETLTTASWDALRLFNQAETLNRQGDRQHALSLYREADGVDPEFALAAARSSDLMMQLNQVDESLSAQKRASELLSRKGVSTRESLRIRMGMAVDNWKFEEGAQAARLYQAQFPEDDLGYYFAADFHRYAGRLEEALALYKRAAFLNPKGSYIHDKLALVCLALRRPQEVGASIVLSRRGKKVSRMDGVSAFIARDVDAARKIFTAMAEDTNSNLKEDCFDGQMYLAALESELGRTSEAIALLQRFLEWSRRENRLGDLKYLHFHLAELYLHQHDYERSRIHARLAGRFGGPWDSIRAWEYLVRLGEDTHNLELRGIRQLKTSVPRLQAALYRLEGEIALAEQKPATALKCFQNHRLLAWRQEFPAGLLRTLKLSNDLREYGAETAGIRLQAALYFVWAHENPLGSLARFG